MRTDRRAAAHCRSPRVRATQPALRARALHLQQREFLRAHRCPASSRVSARPRATRACSDAQAPRRCGPTRPPRPSRRDTSRARGRPPATTPMSCVMKITPMFISSCSPRTGCGSAPGSSSSAVVGSSAISSDGRRQRHRDHHALPHPARQLVRIAREHAARLGMRTSSSSRGFRALPTAFRLMQRDRLADLVADREHRVQRRHRLLEDHRDVRAANAAHRRAAGLREIDNRTPRRRTRSGRS